MTKTYTFDNDSLCALANLLDVVHYDDLAQSWLDLLPVDLLRDIYGLVWMTDGTGVGPEEEYDDEHLEEW